MIFKKTALLFLIFFMLVPTSVKADDFDKLIAFQSVAKVVIHYKKDKKDIGSESGTAFAIDEKHLVTAGHLCKSMMLEITKGNTAEIYIVWLMGNGLMYNSKGFKIKALDNVSDLCMLQSDNDLLLHAVRLAPQNILKMRQYVYTVGAPRGIFPIESEGRVMIPKMQEKEDEGRIMCSMPIYGGNSGSPLFNDDGEVVGVIIAGDQKFQNVGYATNLEDLKKFINKSLGKNE